MLVKIRDDEFQYLCELLYQSYGLNMRKKRVLIEYRLMNILQKYQVNSFQEYFSLLRTDKSGKMKEEMLNKLTTNYSFFMREPQHFEFIKKEILPVLQNIAAHLDDETPCCSWIGPDGSGHFVKTVHNGIEYGDMQLIDEAYSLLNVLQKGDHEATAQTFESWNKGVLDSYLIGITAPILRYKDTDGKSLIDKIADRAGQKGTGKWSIEAAIDSGTTLSVTAESVFARLLSNRTTERNKAHRLYPETNPAPIFELSVDDIHHALYASKIIAYTQGLDLLRNMSEKHNWQLNLADIATIWRKGCIIQSRFLYEIAQAYKLTNEYENLLFTPYFREKIILCLPSWRKVVQTAIAAGIAIPGTASALAWFDGFRCKKSSANLIQAQRDYFGAHLYERIDAPAGTFFHTDWNRHGDGTTSGNYSL